MGKTGEDTSSPFVAETNFLIILNSMRKYLGVRGRVTQVV